MKFSFTSYNFPSRISNIVLLITLFTLLNMVLFSSLNIFEIEQDLVGNS